MKYKAIIETDDFDDFEFFEDAIGKYIHGIDAGSMNDEWIALYFTECPQVSVLDKIRAEIEQLPITDTAIRLVTEIIDKYKEESEEIK